MIEQLELLAQTPQRQRRMPLDPIIRSSVIEGEYRFILKRAWGSGPTILWCGLNPSYADSERDDPTMLREIGFSYRWGFGSLVKVNIYPIIHSNPSGMQAWRKTWDWQAYEDAGMRPWEVDKSSWSAFHHNMGVIEQELASGIETCVAAWGRTVAPEDFEQFHFGVTRRVDTSEHDGFGIIGMPIEWQCLGTNLDGSPVHTLARGQHRVPDDAKLRPWKSPLEGRP